MARLITAQKEKLRSRRPFAPAARKLFSELSKLRICTTQWTDYKWDTKYFKDEFRAMPFCPVAQCQVTWHGSAQTCFGNDSTPLALVLEDFMQKWELAPTSICDCATLDQTASHVILECALHCAPRGYHR